MASSTEMDDLECHFNWIPEDLFNRDINKTRSYTETVKKVNEPHRLMTLLLDAFLWTKGPGQDLSRALKDVKESLDMSRDKKYEKDPHRRRGYELVALGNLACIQNLHGDEDGKKETLERIKFLQNNAPEEEEDEEEEAKVKSQEDGSEDGEVASSESKTRGCIVGIKAFAMGEFNKAQETLILFREAEELDPYDFKWPLGRGIAAGQLNRLHGKRGEDENVLNMFDKEQEESIERAIELSERKDYLAIMRLADVYYWRGRGDVKRPETRRMDLMLKSEKLFREAYAIEPNAGTLLKRIGKAFPEINRKYEEFAEECLLKAEKLDPTNSMTLHRVGNFYEHASGRYRNLKKAEAYYLNAVTSGPSRNLSAEMDLGRVRKKQNRAYDGVKHIRGLFLLYTDPENIEIIQRKLDMMQMSRGLRRLHF